MDMCPTVKELVIDAHGCRQQLRCPKIAEHSVSVLRKAAEKVSAIVRAVHCTTYTEHGFTTVALLAESHILLTTWPEFNYASINIYLCNPHMSHEVVRKHIFGFIQPTNWRLSWFRHVQVSSSAGCRVFLAAPFTRYLKGQDFKSSAYEQITILLKLLRSNGYDVFSAHEREGFGAALMSAPLCTRLDFEEMNQCDVVVAIMSDDSYGVCIELGWASALNKPVILVDTKGNYSSPLVEGLGHVTTTEVVLGVSDVVAAIERLKCPTFLEESHISNLQHHAMPVV